MPQDTWSCRLAQGLVSDCIQELVSQEGQPSQAVPQGERSKIEDAQAPAGTEWSCLPAPRLRLVQAPQACAHVPALAPKQLPLLG